MIERMRENLSHCKNWPLIKGRAYINNIHNVLQEVASPGWLVGWLVGSEITSLNKVIAVAHCFPHSEEGER